MKEEPYRRNIAARAFDISRYLLFLGVPTGVGQVTGWNYVVNDSSHQEVNTRGVAQEQSFGTKMKMISQGSAPNLNERTTLHVVIDSNNNVKVEKSTDTISCK